MFNFIQMISEVMEKRRKKQRALYRFLRENAEIEKQSRDEELIDGPWTIKLGARAFRARKKKERIQKLEYEKQQSKMMFELFTKCSNE